MEESTGDAHGLRRGVIVFVGLAVLTLGEFWVAINLSGSLAFLTIFAVAKTALILEYFMHLSSVFGPDEGGH